MYLYHILTVPSSPGRQIGCFLAIVNRVKLIYGVNVDSFGHTEGVVESGPMVNLLLAF